MAAKCDHPDCNEKTLTLKKIYLPSMWGKEEKHYCHIHKNYGKTLALEIFDRLLQNQKEASGIYNDFIICFNGDIIHRPNYQIKEEEDVVAQKVENKTIKTEPKDDGFPPCEKEPDVFPQDDGFPPCFKEPDIFPDNDGFPLPPRHIDISKIVHLDQRKRKR